MEKTNQQKALSIRAVDFSLTMLSSLEEVGSTKTLQSIGVEFHLGKLFHELLNCTIPHNQVSIISQPLVLLNLYHVSIHLSTSTKHGSAKDVILLGNQSCTNTCSRQ